MGTSPKFIFANCVGNFYRILPLLSYIFYCVMLIDIIPGNMRGKLNGLGRVALLA